MARATAYATAERPIGLIDSFADSKPLQRRAGDISSSRNGGGSYGWRLSDTGASFERLEASVFVQVIEALAAGVFLIDSCGVPVHVNASGRAMLHAGDPLRLARGSLLATGDGSDRALGNLLMRHRQGGAPVAARGMAALVAGRKGDHFMIQLLPLNFADRSHPRTPAAALFVRRATIDLAEAISAVRQLFGLTPAEVKVLRALTEASGVARVASVVGASRATVKTHLGQLFEKTGRRCQADLVRLIAGFDSPLRWMSGEEELCAQD